MVGRKRIVIDKKVDTSDLKPLMKYNPNKDIKEYKKKQEAIISAVSKVVEQADKLYDSSGAKRKDLTKYGLLNIVQAHQYLVENGYNISFRAFGGRVERGRIPCYKIGGRRYIPKAFLDQMLENSNKYYTVREAYEIYKKHDPNINFRAFVARVEKKSFPSVKIGTERMVPREVIKSLVHLAENYYPISEAVKKLHEAGIKINRAAFERRVDRGRIPAVKVGGRRFIHKEVLDEVINKELSLRKKG